MTEKTYTETTYVICHNGSNVIHPSKIEAGVCLSTGQPQLEEFSTEAEWKSRLTELGYDIKNLEPPGLNFDGNKPAKPGLEPKSRRRPVK